MINRTTIQFTAYLEDAEDFKKLQNHYRNEGLYAAELFKDIIEAFKENERYKQIEIQ